MNIEITTSFRNRLIKIIDENPKLTLAKIAEAISINESSLSRIRNGHINKMDPFAHGRLEYFLQNHQLLALSETGFRLANIKQLEDQIQNTALIHVIQNWQNVVDALNETISNQKYEIDVLLRDRKTYQANMKKISRIAEAYNG